LGAAASKLRNAKNNTRMNGFYTGKNCMSTKIALVAAGVGLAIAISAVSLFFPRPRPAILLITIDTLRADRLGVYGNRSVNTPNLDEIGRRGIVFTQTSANVPLTLPSHASILTGHYPVAHGVRGNGDFVLPPGVLTIADRLKARGYETAAFVGSYVLASRFGLNRGFDVYDDAFGALQGGAQHTEGPERRADQVIAAAMRWLEERQRLPFFCWVHLNDPHTPYDPPEPYRSRYAGRLYDGEVAFTDAALRPLLEMLRRKGWYDKMVLAVTGDHGESLGEHGESTHAYFIYESTMHVPLLLKLPGGKMAGESIHENVSLTDLAPTLLALSGENATRLRDFEGVNLRRLRESSSEERPLYGESHYSRLNFGWSALRSLRIANWKYIEAPIPELYRLDQDPAETHNSWSERRNLADAMRRRLLALESEMSRTASGASAVRLDASSLAKIRSLGYLAGAPTNRSPDAADRLPDPKEKLNMYQTLVSAQELVAAGQHRAAARLFEAVVQSDPNIALAHHQLAGCFVALSRPADAIREFERALALNPRFLSARFDLGLAQIQLQLYEEAAANFQQILREMPADYENLNYLGIALSGAGKDDQAMQALQRSIAMQPAFGEAHFNLGRLQIRAGDYSSALESFTKAQRLGFSSGQFHADFGWLRMERKEIDAAIEQYLLALRLNSDDPVVHNNLGFALATKGDFESAIREYRAALDLNPNYERARANLLYALGNANRAGYPPRSH